MKRILIMALVCMLLFLTACGANNTNTNNVESETSSTGKEADASKEKEPVTLKVAFFKGGFGDEWFNWLKEEYEKANPHVTIELEGDAKLNDTIIPRIEGGTDAPDVFFVNDKNGKKWKQWGPQGLILEVSDLYETKIEGTDKTLNDLVLDAAKDYFFYDPIGEGVKKYAVPWSAGPFGVVYNKKMFDENGWEFPGTWQEFEALCEEIKASGVAPITYPGIYKNYVSPFYRGWQFQELGMEKWNEYKNPSSEEIYKDPALKRVWEKWASLHKKGYVLEGTSALNHTAAQMEFINDKAAMILNGYWLENEMKDAWPDDYEIAMTYTPADGVLNKSTLLTLIPDSAHIYGKTKHPEVAKDFLMFALTNESTIKFAELCGGMRPLTYDISNANVTDFIKSCMNAANGENVCTYTDKGGSELMYIDKNYDEQGEVETGAMSAEEAYNKFVETAVKNYKEKYDELNN